MTAEETASISAHFQYLKNLLEEGKLLFAGRRTDAAFGIAVFEGVSELEATDIAKKDPAVIRGVFSFSIGQFQFALAKDPTLLSM